MKYTINEIHGGEIKVTFEDSSWALIRIQSDDSPEMVDERVGAFTNEYVIAEEPNPNISVGEERTTVNPVEAEAARVEAAKAEAQKKGESTSDPYSMDWGNTSSYMSPGTAYYLAQKLAAEGDQSFLAMINSRLQTIQDDPEFSLDALKAAFKDSL